MATYTSKSCPHCGALYETYSSYTKQFESHSGSPFRTCSACGRGFVDKDFQEPAFYWPPEPAKPWQALLAPLFPFGIGGIFVIIICIGLGSFYGMIVSLFPFSFYFYLVYKILKNKRKIYQQSLAEYRASEERVSNRDYILRLLACGYRVPRSFLSRQYPDLVNFKPPKGGEEQTKFTGFFRP